MWKNWLPRLWAFDRRRFKFFALILVAIAALATLGVSVGIFIPIIGTLFFLGGLFIWYVPGVLFAWTGLYEFSAFGAAPSGVLGYIVMILFYGVIAVIVTWPFAPKRE